MKLAFFYAVTACLSPLNAQDTLAGLTAKTPPAKAAELAWRQVSTTCRRPDLPSPSVFFAYTETEYRGTSDPSGPTGSITATRRITLEYLVSGAPDLASEELSQADRLNGHQWAGSSKLHATSSRQFREANTDQTDEPKNQKSWFPWINGDYTLRPVLPMSLSNGKWTIGLVGGGLNIDSIAGLDFVSGVRYSENYANSPSESVHFKRLAKQLPCSKLLSDDPLPDGDAGMSPEEVRQEKEKADEKKRVALETRARLHAAAEANIVTRNSERASAEQAADVTIPASEFEARLRDAVKSRVKQVFGTDASQYEDGVQKLSNLVRNCAGISATDYSSGFTDPARMPNLWPVAGGKYGYCEQYYVRTARMKEGVPPGRTPDVPRGPGLVFYDTLRRNWKPGSWAGGPKFRLEIYLDSPESASLGPVGPINAKYIVMIANITE